MPQLAENQLYDHCMDSGQAYRASAPGNEDRAGNQELWLSLAIREQSTGIITFYQTCEGGSGAGRDKKLAISLLPH